jgi:hypothetical protein
VTTVTETEWDAEARSWALALDQREASLCPCGCGLPASVSQDPENEDRFEVDLPIRCHARTALIRAGDAIGDNTQAPEALLFEQPTLRGDRG